VSAGVLAAIASVSFNLGISMELVAIVAPVSTCSMIVTVILSKIFLKEKVEPNQIIAIFMIFGGILLLAL
jgi:drug/metabolite transporter (DMT)-like permease